MPAIRSMYSRPSRVVRVAPRAATTSSASGALEVWHTWRKKSSRADSTGISSCRAVTGGGPCLLLGEADLLAHPRVGLGRQALAQGRPRCVATQPAERPGSVAADERLVVGERIDERGDRRRVAEVAEGDADVAQQAAPLRALHGRAAEARRELRR